MSIDLTRDVFFVPRAIRQLDANTTGINYGVLCVTDQSLYYVPKQIVQMERLGALTDKYEITQAKTGSVNGVSLEEIVPKLATEMDHSSDLDQFLRITAGSIDGSWVLQTSSIESVKIGYFAQLSLTTGGKKHRFTIGGRQARNRAREFFSARLGLS